MKKHVVTGSIIANFVGSSQIIEKGSYSFLHDKFFGSIILEGEFKFKELKSLVLKKGNRIMYVFTCNYKSVI